MDSVETKVGNGDLLCSVQNRLLQRLALLQMLADVFDGDGGVVHQDTHRQSQASQGHDVDRLAKGRQRDDRGEDRQRNGHGDDQGAAPASEEQQDHQCGQAAGQDRFLDHAVHRRPNEQRLVECGLDFKLRRQPGLHARQFGQHPIHDIQRGGIAVLEDGQQHGSLAVVPNDVGLRLEAVAHVGNVADGRRYCPVPF